MSALEALTRRQFSAIVFLAAVIVVGICFFFTDDDVECKSNPDICPCSAIIQKDKRIGVKYVPHSKYPVTGEVEFVAGQKGLLTSEIADKYVECLQEIRKPIKLVNYARLQTSPIGQVAHQWSRQKGFKIFLRQKNKNEVKDINNLQIGPISGLKWDIMNEWCAEMEQCVVCSEQESNQETVAVEVRLRSRAPLERELWSSGWPKTGTRKPWEDIDGKGDRYLRSCVPRTSQ